MRIQQLKRESWEGYLSSLAGQPLLVDVRLSGTRDDDAGQLWRALRAIRYDAAEDVLVLAVGGPDADRPSLRYFVPAPRLMTLAHEHATTSLIVADRTGAETVITLASAAAALAV